MTDWLARYEEDSVATLYEMYWEKEKTLEEIGRIFGVTKEAIWSRMDRRGIPRRESGYYGRELTREEVQKYRFLFHSKEMRGLEIAEEVGISPAACSKMLKGKTYKDCGGPTRSLSARVIENLVNRGKDD